MMMTAGYYNLFYRGVSIGNMWNDKPSRNDEPHLRDAHHRKNHSTGLQTKEKLLLKLF